jgi:hypothetical protein
MSKIYLYQSCLPIVSVTNQLTQVVQTEKISFTNLPGTIFKDVNGYCWDYLGEYENNYLPPDNVFVVKYSGNFFEKTGILPTIVFPTYDSCNFTTLSTCTEIYYTGTRCDSGNTVVVKTCNVGPKTGVIKLLPTVGQVVGISNPDGDDFCVTLVSITSTTETEYLINTPAWESYDCTTCPLYKTYIANSCDGLISGLTIYDKVTSLTLSSTTSVNINTTCFEIVSYEGIVSEYNYNEFTTPTIIQSFSTCDDCLLNYYNTIN